MKKSQQLFQDIDSVHDLAHLLDTTPKRLYYKAVVLRDKNYKKFHISKKSGGSREIMSPDNYLKSIQRKLLSLLEESYIPRSCVHGYIKDGGVIKNARGHIRQRHILNLDIQDFFQSIHYGRVRGVFMSEPFGFSRQLAGLLASICCGDGVLPTGAPTSPILSNIICIKLDRQLYALAKKYKLFYSRYADDISLSTYQREFPAVLASQSQNLLHIGEELQAIFNQNGFIINMEKARLTSKHQRQEATGVIVNKKLNIKRSYYKEVRSIIYKLKTEGREAVQSKYEDRYIFADGKKRGRDIEQVIVGRVNYIGMVRGRLDKLYLKLLSDLKDYNPSLVKAKVDLYEQLLDEYCQIEAEGNRQLRGKKLEGFLDRLAKEFGLSTKGSFNRSAGGEQIDGSVRINNQSYLFECKWQEEPSDIRDVDSLYGKLVRSGKGAFGVFFSINGWSKHVEGLVTEYPDKRLILFSGDDLSYMLKNKISFEDAMLFKKQYFDEHKAPYIALSSYVNYTS